MKEYLICVILISFVSSVASYVAYPSAMEKSARCAVMTVVIAVSLSPIAAAIGNMGSFSVKDFISNDVLLGDELSEEHVKVAKEAFAKGIKKLLFEKFGICETDSAVAVIGFDFKSMRAQKIKITLNGKSAFADYRSIEEYVEKCGLGECEVNISFGK